MNQQNNIDDLFKNSAQQFSAPAPKRSWAKIDGVLKRKRKVILLQKVLLAATVIILISVAFFVNIYNITTPQLVDNNLDAEIRKPIIKTNNTTTIETKTTDVVNNKNFIDNNNVKNLIKIKDTKKNNEFNENIEIQIVNTDTPLNKETKSKNDIEDNNIITNKDSRYKTQELNIEKEVVAINIIAKSTEVNIKKDKSLNNSVSEETEINHLNNKELSKEIAQADIIPPINEELVIKDNTNEIIIEMAPVSIAIEGNNSKIKDNSTIKEEATEVVKSEKLTQNTNFVESNVVESTLEISEVEEIKAVELITKPIEITPSDQEVQIAMAEARKLEKERADARADLIPKKWDIDFLVSQTYGISVTNGIGKTPEIDNPTISEAGATKANIWFSAAVNIELGINNWIVKSGVRRYNLEIHGDFEVKQKNPWNVDLDKYAFSELGYIKILNINTNLRLAKPSSIIYIQDFNHYDVKVRYVDIPLSVGYKFRRNRLSLVPHIGVNYTMAYSNEVQFSSENGYYMFGEVTDLKDVIIGVTAGCGAYFNVSKHIMVGFDTEMVYYPSSVSTNSTFSYNPYSLLVGPSIAFKF